MAAAASTRLQDEVDAARARDALGPRENPIRSWRCMDKLHPATSAGRLFASGTLVAFHSPPSTPIRLSIADIARLEVEGGTDLFISSRDEKLHVTALDAAADVAMELEELRLRAVDALMQRLATGRGTTSTSTSQQNPSSPPSITFSPLAPITCASALAAASLARRLCLEVRAPLSACHVQHSLAARSMLRGALVEGTLYVSTALMAFCSPAARASLTLPLSALSLPLALDAAAEALCVSVAGRSAEFHVGAERVALLAAEVLRLARLAQLSTPLRPRSSSSAAPPPGLPPALRGPRDDATETVQREAWRTYFAKHGAPDAAMLRTAELQSLVRAFSIPEELRPTLWWHLSGAALLVATTALDYQAGIGCAKRSADEIERDLRRTLPDHPFYQREEGLSALRRVLTAYAARNPNLGYCQSMNFVAALLLLYLPEERAFAVLVLICERFLPAYYTPDMGGSLLDQRVFEELVAERLPRLYAHLTSCGLPIPLLSLSWFLCLYSQILPLHGSLRLLDAFLTEGSPTLLFEVGLSMLALNENNLLHLPDPELLTDALRRTDLNALFARVLDPAHALPSALLQERRARHRRLLVRHLRDENRARDRRRLKRDGSGAVPRNQQQQQQQQQHDESPLGSPLPSSEGARYSPGLLDAIASVRTSLAPGGSPAVPSSLVLREASDSCNSTIPTIVPATAATTTAALQLGGERLQALQRCVELGLLSVQREPKLLARDSLIPRLRSSSSPIRVPDTSDSAATSADSPITRIQADEIFSLSL